MPLLLAADPRSASAWLWIHHGYHNSNLPPCLHVKIFSPMKACWPQIRPIQLVGLLRPFWCIRLHYTLAVRGTSADRSQTESSYLGYGLSLTQWPFRFLPSQAQDGIWTSPLCSAKDWKRKWICGGIYQFTGSNILPFSLPNRKITKSCKIGICYSNTRLKKWKRYCNLKKKNKGCN